MLLFPYSRSLPICMRGVCVSPSLSVCPLIVFLYLSLSLCVHLYLRLFLRSYRHILSSFLSLFESVCLCLSPSLALSIAHTRILSIPLSSLFFINRIHDQVPSCLHNPLSPSRQLDQTSISLFRCTIKFTYIYLVFYLTL